MTVDLETQLDGYGDYVQSLIVHVRAAEVSPVSVGSEAVRPIALSAPVSRLPGWVYAVVAAVVVLVVVGGVALLTGSREGTVPPADRPRVETLERVQLEPAMFDQSFLTSVSAGGPGWVVAGSDSGDVSRGVAAVWNSPDGVRWSRVPHDEIFGGVGSVEMTSLVRTDTGFTGVGSDCGSLPDAEPRTCDGLIWNSPDGVTWSRVGGEQGSISGARLSDVAIGPSGLVAVGAVMPDGLGMTAAVWTSPDGFEWTRVQHESAVFGQGSSEISAVAAGASGFAAIGDDRGSDVIWASRDGISWTRHDLAEFSSADHVELFDVSEGRPGFVIVGYAGFIGAEGPVDYVLTSADGFTWTLRSSGDRTFGDGRITSVIDTGHELLAVGSDGQGDGAAAVWTSPDGEVWNKAVVLNRDGYVADVAIGEGGLIAIGIDAEIGLQPAIWVTMTTGRPWVDPRSPPTTTVANAAH